MECNLKRCKGKRGCICPKGAIPVGSYSSCAVAASLDPGLDSGNSHTGCTKLTSLPTQKIHATVAGKLPPNSISTSKDSTQGQLLPKTIPSAISNPPVKAAKPGVMAKKSVVAATGDVNLPKIIKQNEVKNETHVILGKPSQHEKIFENIDAPVGDDGHVTIRYNHYKKKFQITGGSTTAAAVDAEYYLTFAFPNCKIHLTKFSPSDFTFEDQGFTSRPILPENLIGTFTGLIAEGEQ